MINLEGTRIRRATKNADNPYVMIRKATMEDERLSWEARGILGYVLSKPDDWSINVQDLIRRGPAGKHKIYKTINELIDYGYFERVQIRVDGKIVRYEYIVHECPIQVQDSEPENQPEKLLPDFQETENLLSDFLLPDFQETENLEAENLETENQNHTNNTFQLNNNFNKQPFLLNNNNNKEPDASRAAESPEIPEKEEDVVVACPSEPHPIVQNLIFHGLTETLALRMFEKFDPEYIQEKIDMVEARIDSGAIINNPSGYLIQALYENYKTSGYTKKDDHILTEEDRRKKYIPEEYKDIIRG